MTRLITYICIIALIASLGCSSRSEMPANPKIMDRQAKITPDYSEVVIPPNIAPLNFAIEEEGDDYAVCISVDSGKSIMLTAKDGNVKIPEKAWKTLLSMNKGKLLSIDIYVLKQEKWWKYKSLNNLIAEEDIDSYLVYRWMRNLHHFHERMSLIERSLESFQEKIVLDNKSFGGGCMNCHTFLNGKTSTMTYQIRSEDFGLPMMLVKDGKVTPVDTRTSGFSKSPAAFSSWHPSGKLIAFSVNKVSPLEHTVGQTRGEWDDNSNLAIYNVDEKKVSSSFGISAPGRRETWPAWSADGKSLYFSSAPQLPVTQFRDVQYDLMQISFDPTTEKWGSSQVLISSKEVDMSCVESRVSPDGKWVIFCACDYGQMACFLRSSDLHVLNTQTGEHQKLKINSDVSESWPSWSSNGRWICFISKRRNELLSHVYFSYFDKEGKAHKPFVLPQEDPLYYNSCVNTYNRPELAIEPVSITGSALAKSICYPEENIKPPKTFDKIVK